MRISDWSSDVCSSDLLDLFRRGAGGDVEVLGMAADHQVAHGAADQESLVAALAQAVEHAQRIGTDVLARNRMLVPRDDPQGHGGGTGGFGEGLGRHRQPMNGWGCRFAASVSLLY